MFVSVEMRETALRNHDVAAISDQSAAELALFTNTERADETPRGGRYLNFIFIHSSFNIDLTSCRKSPVLRKINSWLAIAD